MEKSKNRLINILRWVSIIPLVIIIYLTFKFIYSYITNFIVSETLSLMFKDFSYNDSNTYNYINEVNNVQGFAGHYIIGSIYIFTKELFGVAIAIFSGIYIAPSHKRQVGYSLIILIIITSILLFVFMIKTSDQFKYTTETIIRIILEYIGMFAGSYFAWKILPEKDLIKIQK